MLNRRLTDYILYGILIGITALIILLRIAVVGGQQNKIEEIKAENNQLATQIDNLNELVQDNKYIQADHLFELSDIIPNAYSAELLTYKTVAMLEELGIDESSDYNRTIIIDSEIDVGESSLGNASKDYFIVQVNISFSTDDITLVKDLIDLLYQNEQLFIIDTVNYTETNGEFSQVMELSFLAVYDVDDDA